MKRIFLCLAICWGGTVRAATCGPGYYLNDGECKVCSPYGYYCPGDDSMIRCPEDTTDWIAVYTSKGYTVYNITEPHLWSTSKPSGNINDCHTRVYVTVTGGTFHIEPGFDGTKYRTSSIQLWVRASTGYYLSPYDFTTWDTWYKGVKACTNAPENAHYTGSGTPDAPDGSVTNANDCPWECDTGYGKNANDECLPLCAGGATKFHAGAHTFNLWRDRYTAPSLNIELPSGDVCYINLMPGLASGTINVSVRDATYHATN